MVSVGDMENLLMEESEELSPSKNAPLQKTMAVFHQRVLRRRAVSRLGVARASKDRNTRLNEMTTRRDAILEKDTSNRKRCTHTTDSSDSESVDMPPVVSACLHTTTNGVQLAGEESDSDDEPLAYKYPHANRYQQESRRSVVVDSDDMVSSGYASSHSITDVDSDDVEFGVRYATVCGVTTTQSDDECDLSSEKQSEASDGEQEDGRGVSTSKLSANTLALINGLNGEHVSV